MFTPSINSPLLQLLPTNFCCHQEILFEDCQPRSFYWLLRRRMLTSLTNSINRMSKHVGEMLPRNHTKRRRCQGVISPSSTPRSDTRQPQEYVQLNGFLILIFIRQIDNTIIEKQKHEYSKYRNHFKMYIPLRVFALSPTSSYIFYLI